MPLWLELAQQVLSPLKVQIHPWNAAQGTETHLLLLEVNGLNLGEVVLGKVQAVGHIVNQHHALCSAHERTLCRQDAHCSADGLLRNPYASG